MSDDLNIQQRKFVKAYLETGNATKSAIAAGYSKNTAESQGSRLLKNVKIKQALLKPLAQAADKLDITAEKVVEELARVAFADVKIDGSQKVSALSKLLEYLKPNDGDKKDVFNLVINLAETSRAGDNAKVMEQTATALPSINLEVS